MFGGNMKQMMQQMGIDMKEIDASEVIIKLESGEELRFENPDVNKMDAQGQTIHQVMGEPERVEQGRTEEEENEEQTTETEDDVGSTEIEITDEDVNIVSLRAGVSEDKAREKLEENDGDLAQSISELS
jgi:nascent polypeptide-associated complex subunit alpha